MKLNLDDVLKFLVKKLKQIKNLDYLDQNGDRLGRHRISKMAPREIRRCQVDTKDVESDSSETEDIKIIPEGIIIYTYFFCMEDEDNAPSLKHNEYQQFLQQFFEFINYQERPDFSNSRRDQLTSRFQKNVGRSLGDLSAS